MSNANMTRCHAPWCDKKLEKGQRLICLACQAEALEARQREAEDKDPLNGNPFAQGFRRVWAGFDAWAAKPPCDGCRDGRDEHTCGKANR